MYRNFVPILATLIISGGAQQVCAASHQPAHQQQAELSCAVCHQENPNDALFLVCNRHVLVAHKKCMQLRLESGEMRCHECSHKLSEENIDLMHSILSGGDVMPQAAPVEPRAQQIVASSHWELVNRGRRTLEDAEAGYAQLKQLVFEKMGPSFAAEFNRQYPQSSKKAVEQLALHINHIGDWYETPPYATATIGSQETILDGDIACIISDMKERVIYEYGTMFIN